MLRRLGIILVLVSISQVLLARPVKGNEKAPDATKITLKSGRVVEGEIVSYDAVSVVIKAPSLGIITIPRENILKIDPPLEQKKESLTPPVLRKVYLKNGIEIQGEFVSQDAVSIVIRDPLLGAIFVPRENILKIEPPLEQKKEPVVPPAIVQPPILLPSSATKILLKDGQIVEGQIVSQDAVSVVIREPSFGTITIPREIILKIDPPPEQKKEPITPPAVAPPVAVQTAVDILQTQPDGNTQSMLVGRFGYFLASDPAFKPIYGNGAVFGAELRLGGKRITGWLEANTRARTGKFSYHTDEETKVNVLAFEAGALYRIMSGKVLPYAGLGIGYYFYKETNVPLGEAKKSQIGFCAVAGGFTRIFKRLAVDLRIKYSTCRMQPADYKIDIGGLTVGLGLGLFF